MPQQWFRWNIRPPDVDLWAGEKLVLADYGYLKRDAAPRCLGWLYLTDLRVLWRANVGPYSLVDTSPIDMRLTHISMVRRGGLPIVEPTLIFEADHSRFVVEFFWNWEIRSDLRRASGTRPCKLWRRAIRSCDRNDYGSSKIASLLLAMPELV
jgi:hypothetical protein